MTVMNKPHHIPDWMDKCMVCNEGICIEIDKLLEKKIVSSVRAAADYVVESFVKRHGESPISANAVRQRYMDTKGIKKQESMGGSKRTTKSSSAKSQVKLEKNRNSQAPIKLTSNHCRLLEKLNLIRAELQVIGEGILADADCKSEVVRLKGAKKDFSRDKNNPPEGMSPEQSSAWKHYFACAEISCLSAKLQEYYYNQLPEELPEHRAKRGRPKKK